MNIHLRPITRENWFECIKLKPAADQQNFVASNAISLAEAYVEPWWRPCAVYADQTMVGFVMYGRWPSDLPAPLADEEEERLPGIDYILSFMIDERHQGRGYGRAALIATIRRIKALPDTHTICLSYEPENSVAARLYASGGFKPTGRMVGGEIEVELIIDASA